MCIKCVRKSKRLGLSKNLFGKVKFFAHQACIPFRGIPLFRDKRTNIAIEAHVYRIRQAKTFKRRETA
jgi:hypothetical protein